MCLLLFLEESFVCLILLGRLGAGDWKGGVCEMVRRVRRAEGARILK